MDDNDRMNNGAFSSSPPTRYGQSPHAGAYPRSHHGTPSQEYHNFNWSSPQMPMEPSAFTSSIQQRPAHQQLPTLVMPHWPSMLNGQPATTYQHPYHPHHFQPIQPTPMHPLPTPTSASPSRSASTPRKTLTDSDRKRMCQYAEDHPSSKQTEIGAIFGVERSTVSKVLRQKEKYLVQEDGSRSPIKRAKGRSPDIERALAVWAKNQERKGVPLNDDMIRGKARAFAATTTTTSENQHVLSSSWIEKFKLKNNLMGARSRKGSLAPDDADPLSGGDSPISPQGLGSPASIDLYSAPSQEKLTEEPEALLEMSSRNGPFHSQSATSLNSAFSDNQPSSFSPVAPLSPTSPFFTPDSGTAPSPFTTAPNARSLQPAQPQNHTSDTTPMPNTGRPRSQTFPQLDTYMSTSDSTTPELPSTTTAPSHNNSAADAPLLDSPMAEHPDPLSSIDESLAPTLPRTSTVRPASTMRPPPLPAHLRSQLAENGSSGNGNGETSPEDARRALEIVVGFIEQQPSGFLDFQESVHIGTLMEKLRLQASGGS